MAQVFAPIQRCHLQGRTGRHLVWLKCNECTKQLVHIVFFLPRSPAINNRDVSISASEAGAGQTLPLAFEQTSTGTHSPRLPWGGREGGTTVLPCWMCLLHACGGFQQHAGHGDSHSRREKRGPETTTQRRRARCFPPAAGRGFGIFK